jgi:hypothetical protein
MKRRERRKLARRVRRVARAAQKRVHAMGGIPEGLRPALLSAEANCMMHREAIRDDYQLAPTAVVDNDAARLLHIPTDLQGADVVQHLWAQLQEEGGQSVSFHYVSNEDHLCVVHLTRHRLSLAQCPIRKTKGGVALGAWTIQEVTRTAAPRGPRADESLQPGKAQATPPCSGRRPRRCARG